MSFPKNSICQKNEIDRIRTHFENKIDLPCYVVGNGPSSEEVYLSNEECKNSVIFRANWFFLEKEKRYGSRVDGFFWSVDNAGLRAKLSEIQDDNSYEINAFFQPFQASDDPHKAVIPNAVSLLPNFDHWAAIASNPTLARFMMGRPLPTQGMQMIAFAAVLGFKEIRISGIDLYQETAKRYAWDVPDEVKTHLQSKDYQSGYEKNHALDVDLHFLRAIRSEFDFKLIGLSEMNILSPYLDKRERRVSSNLSSKESGSVSDRGEHIYVTLADGRYALGALALARSLSKVTTIPLLVMHSDPMTPRVLSHLQNVRTKKVEKIDNPHAHGQARFSGTFTKLRVFELLEYNRITFIDADCIALKNIDDLFFKSGFLAAPDWGMDINQQFNSGLFSFTPSEEMKNLVFSSIHHCHSSDGGDQGFLNEIFLNKVQYLSPEYNTLKRLIVHHPNLININDSKVLHFVGDNPWDIYQMKREFIGLEDLWCKFLEGQDWQHFYWMNKKFISRRWNKNKPSKMPESNIGQTISFSDKYKKYGFFRRALVKLGRLLFPSSTTKFIYKSLKKWNLA